MIFRTNASENLVYHKQIRDHAQPAEIQPQINRTYSDVLLEQIRENNWTEDFKPLSDLVRRNRNQVELTEINKRAERIARERGKKARALYLLRELYQREEPLLAAGPELSKAKWRLSPKISGQYPEIANLIDYIESTLSKLVRKTPVSSQSSRISLPFPFVIAGERFSEVYYWDSYFVNRYLLRSGRTDLALMQIENFLFMIRNYGINPNGARTYYLSRSQPPLLTRMIMDWIDIAEGGKPSVNTLHWLRESVLPLLEKDYRDFWMNPDSESGRYNSAIGLNHFNDAEKTNRPEAHSADQDGKLEPQMKRSRRAMAESGKDFSITLPGDVTKISPVFLNSVLYQVELDLGTMHEWLGQQQAAKEYQLAASRRRQAMNAHLWDESVGIFRDLHLNLGKLPFATPDTFAPLYFGIATRDQAKAIVATALGSQKGTHPTLNLEGPGGVYASNVFNTGMQWDAPYAWAPQNYIVMIGAKRYGFNSDAIRIGAKWINSNSNVLKATGVLVEKVDGQTASAPKETGAMYPTQRGFGWTNSVTFLTVTEVLGLPLAP